MGSGLATRRGLLRKPAECKPPPPPPPVPNVCLCLIHATDDSVFESIIARVSASSVLHPPGAVVAASVSSVPALTWFFPGTVLNFQTELLEFSSTTVPGTWYRLTVDFVFPDGTTCSASVMHFAL